MLEHITLSNQSIKAQSPICTPERRALLESEQKTNTQRPIAQANYKNKLTEKKQIIYYFGRTMSPWSAFLCEESS